MADSNPAPVASNAKSPLLTIVLLPMEIKSTKDEPSKYYTTMRFPGSYQDAVDAALKGFVHLIPAKLNAKPADFEILCPRRNHENTLVWSTFDAADWDLVVEATAGEMLGLRQKRTHGKEAQPGSTDNPALEEEPFIVGNVGLTYGTFHGGTINWSSVQVLDTGLIPQIRRPKSYAEAVEIIKTVCGQSPGFPSSAAALDSDLQFKFYKFTSARGGKPTTDWWVDLPEEAYPHGFVWRLFVPKPREILGFTLSQKRSTLQIAASPDGSAIPKLEA